MNKNMNTMNVRYITPWEPFKDFCDFYAHMGPNCKALAEAEGIDTGKEGSYANWYTTGGYGYDPTQMRNWLVARTEIGRGAAWEGTCLDIGSGDGFWTWILSEFYQTTGIEPCVEAVQLSNAIKGKLGGPIAERTDFIIGDALEVEDKYDVIFCRAPSFLNYPINKPFSKDLLDLDRKKLFGVWRKHYPPEIAQQKIDRYPPANISDDYVWEYADKAKDYFKKMIDITGKYFIFILSTQEAFYGEYLGDTYNHDPQDVYEALKEHGDARVKVVDGYIVAELIK